MLLSAHSYHFTCQPYKKNLYLSPNAMVSIKNEEYLRNTTARHAHAPYDLCSNKWFHVPLGCIVYWDTNKKTTISQTAYLHAFLWFVQAWLAIEQATDNLFFTLTNDDPVQWCMFDKPWKWKLFGQHSYSPVKYIDCMGIWFSSIYPIISSCKMYLRNRFVGFYIGL